MNKKTNEKKNGKKARKKYTGTIMLHHSTLDADLKGVVYAYTDPDVELLQSVLGGVLRKLGYRMVITISRQRKKWVFDSEKGDNTETKEQPQTEKPEQTYDASVWSSIGSKLFENYHTSFTKKSDNADKDAEQEGVI